MTPMDLLLSALAFLGVVIALWLFVFLILFVITVTKPRGKSFKPRGKVTSRRIVMHDRDPKVRS